jgi:hypothetical protein
MIGVVRRFALAVVVGLLAFSASGVSALAISEPCTGYELPGQDDGNCPPTCVTCGCCAQGVEPSPLPVTEALPLPSSELRFVPVRYLKAPPSDILHVPRFHSA